MYGRGVDAYRQTDVMTADPKRLVIMCYEGAISNLRLAKEKHAEREYESKAKALQKAHYIIGELAGAVDFEKGGEIAKNLNAIYRYMLRRITEADIRKNVKGFDEVVGMLEELREAWEEIFYGSTKDSADIVAPHMSDQSSNQDISMTYGSRTGL